MKTHKRKYVTPSIITSKLDSGDLLGGSTINPVQKNQYEEVDMEAPAAKTWFPVESNKLLNDSFDEE